MLGCLGQSVRVRRGVTECTACGKKIPCKRWGLHGMDDMVVHCLRHRCFLGLLLVFERFRDLRFNFFAEFRVVLQNAFHGIASLTDFGLAIAEP